ncbi:MAG TPA: alginate lyase family protein [Kofleriaceae bacterium]
MRRAARAAFALLLLPAALSCTRSSASRADRLSLPELRTAVRARPAAPLFRRKDPTRSDKRIEQLLRKQTAAVRASGWSSRDRPFPVEPPIDWGADPFRDRNWRFQLSSLEFLPAFLQLHDETGDPEALRYARAVLLDWADYHLERRLPDDFAWNDHATGLRATRLAYVLDRSLRGDDLGAADLARLLAAAREHVRHLSNPKELAPNNHALFQLGGLAGLCAAVPELDGCEEGRAYASREFSRIVEQQFVADGIHSENSPSYQGYVLESIDLILSFGWLDLSPELRQRLDRAWVNLPWLVRPDGLFARVGDSSGDYGKVQRAIVAARVDPSTGPPGHRAFRTGGYAIARAPSGPGPTYDGYLFLTASFNSRSHKHRDALSFEWFDAGAPILVDAGAYSANFGTNRDYVGSSRAHNTIEVDGGDIDTGRPRPPTLVASGQRGDLYALAAEVTHVDLAVRHRRVLLFAPGRWLLVHDEVTAERPRAVTVWFHVPPGATYRPGAAELGIAEIPGVGPLRVIDLTGGAEVRAVRGQTLPRLEGWVVSGYGQLVDADAVALTREGTSLTFDTLFLLGTSSTTPSMVSPPDLCWRDGAAVHGARVTVKDGSLDLAPCPSAD